MKTNLKSSLAALAIGAAIFSGCADEQSLPADDSNASFGGSSGKADGLYSHCDLRSVLNYLNESSTTAELLNDQGVNSRAATNIITHRNGPDGDLGTGDDNLFDDLDELDAVSYVGPVTLKQVVTLVDERCVVDLSGRPFIDSTTFEGSTGGGYTRDNVELEAAMTVTGITGAHLHAILTDTDSRGRTIFSRLRKSKKVEGFTYDYALDEVPWGGDAMDGRDAMKYIAMSIESGRFDADPGERRKVSLGTDTMDDTYYDTNNFALFDNGITARGRVRWDTDTEVRRLLIAAKFDSAVNAEGLKQAAKVDVRTEGGDHVPTLNNDVRSGMVPWSGGSTPIEPIREVYDRLVGVGALPDIDGYNNVLLLDPVAHIRSFRSRYHLNEASMEGMQRVHRNGYTRIEDVLNFLEAGIGDSTIQSSNEINQVIQLGKGILDGTAVEASAKAQLDALGATTDVVMPDEFTRPSELLELDKQQVVSEVVDSLMKEWDDLVDEIDREASGTDGLDGDDYLDYFIAWQKADDNSLVLKTTAKPFIAKYDAISPAAGIAALNEFGQQERDAGNGDFEDFEPIDEMLWENLGKHLDYEFLKTSRRMVRFAGTSANALWFEMARQFYVPNSSRSSYSNFIIDTIDYTEMVSHPEWKNIPEDQRNPANTIDPAKIFHTNLVNEVQIELGKEEAFLERIAELEEEIATNGETEETKRLLEGTRFVFGEYRGALTAIAELKGDDILDRLEDEGAPSNIEWVPSAMSKGKTAISILGDLD